MVGSILRSTAGRAFDSVPGLAPALEGKPVVIDVGHRQYRDRCCPKVVGRYLYEGNEEVTSLSPGLVKRPDTAVRCIMASVEESPVP
jgi:hypothetical protein